MSSLPTTDQLLNAIPRQAYYQNLQGYNYLALQLPPPPPDLILQTCLRSGRLAVPLIQHFRIRSQCHAARMLICAGHCHWVSVRYFSLLEKMDRWSLFDDVYNWIEDLLRPNHSHRTKFDAGTSSRDRHLKQPRGFVTATKLRSCQSRQCNHQVRRDDTSL